jgi:ABC-type nitrate/sulfonate/bicarbonate transport system ATPase subunit/ABC-type nitrate/sulfonate/bicarbonate transport system substrate-binding protein
MIEIKGISQKFDRQGSPVEVFNYLSLSVEKGEIVALVGPSGCGKSTLLRMIAGLTKIQQGEIIVSNKKVTGADSNKGFVFQNFSLFPWLTVKENIAFSSRLKKVTKEQENSIAKHYLQITGLDQFADVYPKQLSGGMQQRVAIARTLASNPEVLLMDEPFGSLDTQTRSYLQDFLLELLSEEKKTTILVTHDPEEALYLADRVIVLSPRPGKIIEDLRVPFPRSRTRDIKYDAEFQSLKKYITYLIYAESIRSKTDEAVKVNEGLTVGSNIWPGILPLYLAEQKGIYTKNGLTSPHLVTVESSDTERLAPLLNGSVEILNIPLDQALIGCDQNPELRIIMAMDVSTGGDVVLAHDPISSIPDLKGKKIAVEKSWTGYFFLCYVLAKFGMSSKDVQIQDISTRYVPGEIINKKVDAGVVQEPWLSQIRAVSELKQLASTVEYPVIYSVLITKVSTYEAKKSEILRFKECVKEAIEYYENNKKESISITAPRFSISPVDLGAQLEKLSFVKDSDKLKADLPEIEMILIKENMVQKNLNIENFLLL